jgi:uncharacterized protein (DUF362 family)
MKRKPAHPPSKASRRCTRRALLAGAAAAVGAVWAAKWLAGRNRDPAAATAVFRVLEYDAARVSDALRRGLRELGLDQASVAGKCVLLKPNLIEPSRASPHINTHPILVRCAAEEFRRLGAREVLVGEGTGHERDTQLVLEESGLAQVLREDRIEFIDFNHDEVTVVGNRLRFSTLKTLALPKSLGRCDLLVSLPKLKTHHWAGVTLSMKNLFGLMPGVVYGWPKNALHWAGIDQVILDINGVARPAVCIVDGIVGMEGDGPIMGEPKQAGVLVMGRNPVSVDATATRLMGFDPARVDYLAMADGVLGPLRETDIEQRGEPVEGLVQAFRQLDHPAIIRLRAGLPRQRNHRHDRLA